MRQPGSNTRSAHAVVCGGGFAGLLCARVLSDHFTKVTVLEKDPQIEPGKMRRGVPQAAHVHTLLKRGELVLEELFPGIAEDFLRGKCPENTWNSDVHFFHGKLGVLPRYPGHVTTHRYSRVFLEDCIRARVTAIGNVTFRTGTTVESLIVEKSPLRVVGANLITEGETRESLVADFFVDATGRSGQLLKQLWAEGIGNSPIAVREFPGGYATRIYRFSERPRPWKTVYLNHREWDLTGMIAPIENGLHMVALIGGAPHYPPADEAGFLAYIKSLPETTILDELTHAEPLSSISVYRKLENRCKLLHVAESWPEGLIAVGDTLCCMNPAFAQGMTAAGLTAQLLGRMFQEGSLLGREEQFHERAIRQLASIWQDNTAFPLSDFLVRESWVNWPIRKARRFKRRVRSAVLSRVALSLHLDPKLKQLAIERDHMLVDSPELLRPTVLIRALWIALCWRVGRKTKR